MNLEIIMLRRKARHKSPMCGFIHRTYPDRKQMGEEGVSIKGSEPLFDMIKYSEIRQL